MTRLSDAFPGNYIKAADLNGREYRLVIDYVKQERMTGSDDEKYVLYFKGAKLGLVLNKTNGYVIGETYGEEMDSWNGCAVILYPTKVDFAGKLVDAIRVKIAASSVAPVAALPPVPAPTPVAVPAPAPVPDQLTETLPGGAESVPF